MTVRRPPRRADELPAGHLAEALTPILEVRALLELGAVRLERRSARLLAGDGSTSVLAHLETVTPLDGSDQPVGEAVTLLRLAPGPGGPGALAAVLAAIDHVASPTDELARAAAARGRSPGDYVAKPDLPLVPGQPAAGALTAILRHQLEVVELNTPGAIADLDSEFLHDLRVAVRRSRAVLGQLEGVLTAEGVAPHLAGLKWLGGLTGPARDLDVYQLELDASRALLPTAVADHLGPLERQIRRRRGRARAVLVRGLRSTRYQRLLVGWRELLELPLEQIAGPEGTTPLGQLIDRRLGKAVRRVLRRGRRLGVDPPAEALHRLRIDCKKLRYLLEFFGGIYPARALLPAIRQLKALQDALGGFNDMVVQRRHLVELAGELSGAPDIPPETLLAMGRLDAALEQRGEEFRRAFHDVFDAFADDAVQQPLADALAGEERDP